MAQANYRVLSLLVEGFRGFTTPNSIDFDGRNVFIFGENGLGKSSIIEAIQWCLFGGTDIQVRNSNYEKQECRVVLRLSSAKGSLTIRRELRPGHTESDLRIEDRRGREVALRDVFPQLAKLRSAERTQVIFAAQHASGRRTRADLSQFGSILYFYLELEDVPDLIKRMSDLIEEQTAETEKFSKRIETVAEGYRAHRRQLLALIDTVQANPPWGIGASPTETETEGRITDFVQEVATLVSQPFSAEHSPDQLLQKAEEWLNLQMRDMAAFQNKLNQRSQRIDQLAALVPEIREAAVRMASADQRLQDAKKRVKGILVNTSHKALVSEIERRAAAQSKVETILAIAESVARFCEKYELDSCPACGSNLDHETLMEQVTSQLKAREFLDARGEQLKDLRQRLQELDAAVAAENAAAAEITAARNQRDANLRKAMELIGRPAQGATLGDIEAHVTKVRGDLALNRNETDDSAERHTLLLRRVSNYRHELRYHAYRRQVSEVEKRLSEGMEGVHKSLRDRVDYLRQVEELKELVEAAFKNALDRAIPRLNELLTTVYQRLTGQRSFELVCVYHDPARIGHLELRVASKRKPDKTQPPNVLNGQAQKALSLVPYLVFSQFRPEVLELDLLLIDDPSESFDTSHVAMLVEELSTASEHAQLIVASHEKEKFAAHVGDHFTDENCIMMAVSDFDAVSGPRVERQPFPN